MPVRISTRPRGFSLKPLGDLNLNRVHRLDLLKPGFEIDASSDIHWSSVLAEVELWASQAGHFSRAAMSNIFQVQLSPSEITDINSALKSPSEADRSNDLRRGLDSAVHRLRSVKRIGEVRYRYELVIVDHDGNELRNRVLR